MKIIEAMKRVKSNKEKITDLQQKIGGVSANLTYETPLYGVETPAKIAEWAQSCDDCSQENIRLLVAIARTNLVTPVTITLADKAVTKPIAEWIWRRREYAKLDLATWAAMGDRNLKEMDVASSTGGEATKVRIVRHYDVARRDGKIAEYKSEPHEIDAALEVVNAVTDLIEK